MLQGVSLVTGLEYDGLESAWDEVLKPLELGDVSGKRILLKPNLMLAVDPDAGTCTHPQFVISLARHLMGMGAKVSVGDSSGAIGLSTRGARSIGLVQGLAEIGSEFIDFDRVPLERYPINGSVLKEIPLPRPILDAELVINVPKLKTHTLMGLSCAVKNAMGCIPGAIKPLFHAKHGARMDRLAVLLADICRAVAFHGHVMDAVHVREGGGSQQGRPRPLGIAAASRDPVRLDALAARLAGWEKQAVPTIAAAQSAGLGRSSLDDLEIEVPRADPPLQRPGRDPKTNPLIGRIAYTIRAKVVSPVVLADPEPGGITQCIEACPWVAISAPPLRIDRSRCTGCLICAALCPEGTIGLKVAWPLRSVFSKRSGGLAPDGRLPIDV